MAKTCEYCVYLDPNDSTCRHDSPSPALTGSKAVVWPQVANTDWCAKGFNPADGFYDPSPAVGHG